MTARQILPSLRIIFRNFRREILTMFLWYMTYFQGLIVLSPLFKCANAHLNVSLPRGFLCGYFVSHWGHIWGPSDDLVPLVNNHIHKHSGSVFRTEPRLILSVVWRWVFIAVNAVPGQACNFWLTVLYLPWREAGEIILSNLLWFIILICHLGYL